MKLMQYTRPGLAWPTFGRLTSLQDELERMFESPLQAWTPALDVHEDKDNYTIRVELPGMNARKSRSPSRMMRWSFRAKGRPKL